ncbi:hypothetical protein E2542_SST02521 [Spatholobus suberectus]|nr:hypothetical protein E2542_SST02521 [Spatholobus suberectus]
MAGGSNSKKPISRGTDSTNSVDIIEGNNVQVQVQEQATVMDQRFYDGIPCFADVCFLHKSRSIPKVMEVSLLLGRAGTIGCGTVLDTIGSSITNLNAGSGISRELNAQRLSRDEPESIMQQLMTLVQFTFELYHQLDAWDKFQQDFQHKCEEEDQGDGHKPLIGHMSNYQRLGPAGLALHYANIVLQIDTLVAKSTMPTNTKDALYQSLPPNIKLALRSKLPSLRVVEELTVADITDEMEKTLHWLVPMATKTSKAHRRYGWVGEWANTGSEVNRKTGVMRIETFHHADKDKVEYYIFELLLWLHRLAIRSKADSDTG